MGNATNPWTGDTLAPQSRDNAPSQNVGDSPKAIPEREDSAPEYTPAAEGSDGAAKQNSTPTTIDTASGAVPASAWGGVVAIAAVVLAL